LPLGWPPYFASLVKLIEFYKNLMTLKRNNGTFGFFLSVRFLEISSDSKNFIIRNKVSIFFIFMINPYIQFKRGNDFQFFDIFEFTAIRLYMAVVTKRNAIIDIPAFCWMAPKWQDMMYFEVVCCMTYTAHAFVSLKNSPPPFRAFWIHPLVLSS